MPHFTSPATPMTSPSTGVFVSARPGACLKTRSCWPIGFRPGQSLAATLAVTMIAQLDARHVAQREASAAHDRLVDRGEVTGVGELENRCRLFARIELLSRRLQLRREPNARRRQRVNEADALCSRQRGDRITDTRIETDHSSAVSFFCSMPLIRNATRCNGS